MVLPIAEKWSKQNNICLVDFLLNRCLPLNFRAEDLASGILRERVKVGASLADVDPMIVDKSVGFVRTFYFPSLSYA